MSNNKCRACGRDVGFSYVDKHFCNEGCIRDFKKRNGYYKKKYRDKNPKILLKVCEVCHVKFEPNTNGVKYCSKPCLNVAAKIRKNQNIKIGIPLAVYRKVKILGLL